MIGNNIRERVLLPWYNKEGKEMGNTSFYRFTQSNTNIQLPEQNKPFKSLLAPFWASFWGKGHLSRPVGHPKTPSLSPLFCNCIQKAMTSVRFSWDVGFKKPRLILLSVLYYFRYIKNEALGNPDNGHTGGCKINPFKKQKQASHLITFLTSILTLLLRIQ